MTLSDYRAMMDRCSNCSACKWIPFDKVVNQRFAENCPSSKYFNFNTYSARGKFQLGQVLLDNYSELTEAAQDAIRSCMSCGACDVACKICRYNLEPLETNIALKEYVVENNKALPVEKEIMEQLKEELTMIRGKKKKDRLNWTEGLDLADATKEDVDVLFFAGCKYSYDEKLWESLKKAVNIIQKSGKKVGIMGNADMCCAGRAHQMGFAKEFEERARANIKAFENAGIKLIVTPCSDCYHAFKRQYMRLGMKDIEVLHIVEYIEALINDGTVKFTREIPKTVTYHDPCHLGRLGEPYEEWKGKEKKYFNQLQVWEPRRPRYNGINGIYDAPRNIIKSIPGVKLVEMSRIREYSWCCGAGGGCSESNPEFSSWTAGERVTEANSTGAEAIVTACPWCIDNLTGAEDEKGNTMEVIDILDLVSAAM